jgi:hypothetical protein
MFFNRPWKIMLGIALAQVAIVACYVGVMTGDAGPAGCTSLKKKAKKEQVSSARNAKKAPGPHHTKRDAPGKAKQESPLVLTSGVSAGKADAANGLSKGNPVDAKLALPEPPKVGSDLAEKSGAALTTESPGVKMETGPAKTPVNEMEVVKGPAPPLPSRMPVLRRRNPANPFPNRLRRRLMLHPLLPRLCRPVPPHPHPRVFPKSFPRPG